MYKGTLLPCLLGTKVRRYEGTKVRRYEGTKVLYLTFIRLLIAGELDLYLQRS